MKIKIVSFLVIMFLAAAAFGQETKPNIDSLGWMSSCWEQTNMARNSFGTEQWMKPAGKMMLGMSQSVKNGTTFAFEFLRIVQDDTGIFYISKPSQNKEETSFKLIKFGANEVVFENPAHDFPQRIIYRLEKSNLFARIEGTNNGKFMGIDFPMKRAKCE